MSYLDWPRLHFSGRFQADTSTINNDVRHYKSDSFEPQFQERMVGQGEGGPNRTNGYWNPEGSGAWRMLGCTITGAQLRDTWIDDPAKDAIIGARLGGSTGRVAGKLVDLDPQQQAVSQIWGLAVTLLGADGAPLLESSYGVSTFTDLWKRQRIAEDFDQTLAACFQSQLRDLTWGELSASPVLQALRAVTDEGRLSIRFNAYGFDRSPQADDYTTGRIEGTIGPARTKEPVHFVLGRQLVAALTPNPTLPAQGVYGFQCQVHQDRPVLTADLGHCLPISTPDGGLADIGVLGLAVLHDPAVAQGDVVPSSAVSMLGSVDYTSAAFRQRSGVLDFNYADNDWFIEHIADHPIALVRVLKDYVEVLVRETAEGLFARPDGYVVRLNPGQQEGIAFFGSRYGQPAALCLKLPPNNSMIGGSGTAATLNDETWPVPAVATPTEALTWPDSLTLDAEGRGELVLSAAPDGPGCPRGYLDGQVYGVGMSLAEAPEGYVYNPWNFVSVLAFDAFQVPDKPTWYAHIQPILEQYGNLYPIMSKHLVDLGSYDSVVRFIPPLILSFSLPQADPNHMPVSRDLSENKRQCLLKWLSTPGPDGLPLRGAPEDRPVAARPQRVEPPPSPPSAPVPDPGGKMDFIKQVLARRDGDAC